jgi:hypothetical protein
MWEGLPAGKAERSWRAARKRCPRPPRVRKRYRPVRSVSLLRCCPATLRTLGQESLAEDLDSRLAARAVRVELLLPERRSALSFPSRTSTRGLSVFSFLGAVLEPICSTCPSPVSDQPDTFDVLVLVLTATVPGRGVTQRPCCCLTGLLSRLPQRRPRPRPIPFVSVLRLLACSGQARA